MLLLYDDQISVSGTLFQPKNSTNIYFESFFISSPKKVQLYVDQSGVEILGKNILEQLYVDNTHMRQVGDIILDIESRHQGPAVLARIVNGPAFE